MMNVDVRLSDDTGIVSGKRLILISTDKRSDLRLLLDGDAEEAVRALDRLVESVIELRGRVLAEAAREGA